MRSCDKAGLPAPRFKEDHGALWVTFPHKTNSENKVGEKVGEKISSNQITILEIIKKEPHISAKDLAEKLKAMPVPHKRYAHQAANLMMGAQLMEQARQHGVEKFVALGTSCAYPKFAPL